MRTRLVEENLQFDEFEISAKLNLVKNGCVSLGADTTAQAVRGDQAPDHDPSKLGDHSIILGRPFLSYVAASVEADDYWVPTRHGQWPYPGG